MRIWFIRHAEAVDAASFSGNDMERPLTAQGRRTAKACFTRLAGLRRGPDIVLSSEAVRAWETASIFCLCFRISHHERSEYLNPGCSTKAFKKAMKELSASVQHVAVVGHEPDFSELITKLTADDMLSIQLRKNALAEVDIGRGWKGQLQMLLPPDIMM